MKRLLARFGARPGARSAVRSPLYVDEGNRAAASAIGQLAAGRVRLPMPLVLIGPPDSGKTRLLEEFERLVAARGGVVESGDCARWARRVSVAARERTLAHLAEAIDRADLLVIDELHRLRRARVTRDLLMARLAARIEAGKCTAIATRHAPREVWRLPERAVSLLLGGMVLHVAPPGPAVRRRFLGRVGAGKLAPEEIDRLCAATTGGLRALQEAYASSGATRGSDPRAPIGSLLTVDRLAVAVGRDFGVEASALLGRRRTLGLVRARAALLLSASRLGLAPESMARALDGRGVAAIGRATRRAEALASSDREIAAAVGRVVERIARERRASGAGGPA